jgi:predicted RecA/RadA family phage recombinase
MGDTTAYGPTASVGLADFESIMNQDYHTMPYTNATGTDIANGDIVNVNGVLGMAVGPIDKLKSGTLVILTTINVRKKYEAISQGAAIYWDATGDPYLGTTGAGAATGTATGNLFMGRAIVAALIGDERVRVLMIPNANGMTAFTSTTIGNVISGGIEQDVWTASATQNYALGTVRQFSDGRRFRYCQAGASGITRALMQQTAVADSKFLDITQTGHSQTAGSKSITVLCTTGSAVAANYFTGGHLLVTTGTNAGDIYPILTSTLEVTDTLLDLVLSEALRNNIAATDKIAVIPNRWKKTVVVPTTTATAAPAGVPLIDVTASYYYWAQVRGPAPLFVDTADTIVVGSKVGIPATNAVAGAGGVTTATAFAYPIYGTVMWIAAAGEPALVNLEIE